MNNQPHYDLSIGYTGAKDAGKFFLGKSENTTGATLLRKRAGEIVYGMCVENYPMRRLN